MSQTHMGCVDLTQDQFPDSMERSPSPMVMSSPTRVVPKDKIISNPLFLQVIDKDMVDGNLSDK